MHTSFSVGNYKKGLNEHTSKGSNTFSELTISF